MYRLVVLLSLLLLVGACQGAPAATSGPLATGAATDSTLASIPAGTAGPNPTSQASAEPLALINLPETTDLGAASDKELEMAQQVRNDAGFVALVGPDGAAVFTSLDAIEEEFAQALIAEVAAAVDAGELPNEGALTQQPFAVAGDFAREGRGLQSIDINLFANTGFTTTAFMAMLVGIIQRAGESREGTLPRSQSIDQTDNGIRQQVDLGTSVSVRTGGGHVMVQIIMTATDRISNAATGDFIALYTSRSTGQFDVNACPDEHGVGEGTYTFETKHELNDVSGAQAARSGGGRSVDAPFRVINGDDAHLVQIEASLDMQADANGPGSPGGPGPTSAFDWGASQRADIVMPAGGSTTGTSAGVSVTGTGGQGAGGAMFLSSAMTQLFLAEVGKQAEEFWRKGECIEINTTKESKKVSPGENVRFDATAKGKFDGADIDAPIKGTFSGKESLDPDGEEQDPPASLTFKAGSEIGDKGTIQLEQVGVRGIGKKTLEFEVGPSDYRWDQTASGMGGMSGQKCDGKEGAWTVNLAGPGGNGSYTFTLREGSDTAQANADYFVGSGAGQAHWVMSGPVTFTEGDPPSLVFGQFNGSTTVKAGGQTHTVPAESAGFTIPLEEGDFCQ